MGRLTDHAKEGAYVRAVIANPGASQSEIAAAVGVNYNAARSYLRRLRRRGTIDHRFGRGWYFVVHSGSAADSRADVA